MKGASVKPRLSEGQRFAIAVIVMGSAAALSWGALLLAVRDFAYRFGADPWHFYGELGQALMLPALVAVVAVVAGAWLWLRSASALARKLADEEAHHRAVVETAVDGIITIDGKGIVHSFNKAAERIFGYSAHEVIGNNVSMLMPAPYRAEHDGYLARYHATGEKRIIGIGREVQAQRKDGSVLPIELAVSEAHASLFTGLIRDITKQKEQEQQREALIAELEQKNAELERFTYTVSHDLKSPLITISGFVGGLEKDARAGNFERLRSDVERIKGAVARMQNLMDELLELSRVGRIVNAPVDVSLLEVARQVAHDLAGPLQKRGVELVIAPELPVVRGDRVRLHEVVQNLVENAVKFMGDQQAPRVEVGVKGTPPVFYVRDNGIGVDPRYQQRIFGLFDKLDKDTPGTGIGLALVKRIIELHGGKIWVESDGVGQGSTFCFTIGNPRPAGRPPAEVA